MVLKALLVLKKWAWLFSLVLSISAFAFSIAAYVKGPMDSYRRVLFQANLMNSLLYKTEEICSRGAGPLCENFITQTEKMLGQVHAAVASERTNMAPEDFEQTMLMIGGAESGIALLKLGQAIDESKD